MGVMSRLVITRSPAGTAAHKACGRLIGYTRPREGGDVVGDIQLGNIAEWTAAIGTVGTLSFALWQLNRERQRRQREQARLVAAWLLGARPPADQGELRPWMTEVDLVVRNGSSEPVYNCAVYIWISERPKLGEDAPAIGSVIDILPPDTQREDHVYVDIPYDDFEEPFGMGHVRLDLLFTDAQGAHWHRDPSGRLATRREGFSA
jgi:hypothetical protein